MKQIQPVVIGYRYVEYNGEPSPSWWTLYIPYNKEQLLAESKWDLQLTGIKSKFKPVYETRGSV